MLLEDIKRSVKACGMDGSCNECEFRTRKISDKGYITGCTSELSRAALEAMKSMEKDIADLKKDCNRLYEENVRVEKECVKLGEDKIRLEREISEVRKYNAELVAAKMQENEEIRIGDEVEYRSEIHSEKFIVTDYDKDEGYIGGITLKGDVHWHGEDGSLQYWHRTGRHFDIEGVLEGWRKGGGMPEMPETKWGKCSWCGRHGVPVKMVQMEYAGKLVLDWICERCMDVCRRGLYGVNSGREGDIGMGQRSADENGDGKD